MRRYSGQMWGQRYLGDKSKLVAHDLGHEKPECKIDAIIATGKEMPFNSLFSVRDADYDYCEHCIGDITR